MVPLIEKLAHTFEDIFPYLTVAQVWLIHKSKEGHGFQGWHQDKVGNIKCTIVVNLGSEDVNADNVQGEVVNPIPDVDNRSCYHLKRIAANMMLYKYQGKGAKHPQQIITYKQRLMEKYLEATCHDKITLEGGHVRNEEESISQSTASSVCQLEMEKKNRKQEGQAVKHMTQCGKTAQDNGCEVGAIVTVKVGYRTHCHAPGLLGVVYTFQRDTGGALVCCEHGIITHDGSKNDYWVPYDKYRVVATKDSQLPISPELQAVPNMELAGAFDVKLQ
jgi:hypothetical protein